MKRSSSPENDDGPAQKRLTDKGREKLNKWNQFYKQVDTSGKVIWSSTVEIADEIVFDCSIKVHPQDEVINSLLPQKQLTIHSIPFSTFKSLHHHKILRAGGLGLILCIDENTDIIPYGVFSQAIFGSDMFGCTVLKNSASSLHLLFVYSSSSGHEDYIKGFIGTYQENDTVLGILRSHRLLPCVNQEHYEVLEKEKTELEEELKCSVQMLHEEQILHQELKELVEKKEGEIVSLQGDMEEKINLVEEQEMKLTEMEKKIEVMNTQTMEKDNALSVKDTKIMTLQQNQHKVEKMLKGALRIVSHSDAGREGLHNINQSSTEADTVQILMMESSRLELQNEVTVKQAALDEIGNMMENEFRCSICSELFIKTVTLNCSHSFCAVCIQKWQKDKRTCPNCRNIITASVRSVVLDSLIEKIIDKSGDEAKRRRNETLKERERDMQQEGQLCAIPKYVRHSDDETSSASSPASSLAHLSPSAAFMSPCNPGTSCSIYSPYAYSPSYN